MHACLNDFTMRKLFQNLLFFTAVNVLAQCTTGGARQLFISSYQSPWGN